MFVAEGEYFDLADIPERYTGYSGPSTHRVWRAIYEENCFGLSEMNLLTGKSPASVSLPDTLTDVLRAPVNGEDTNDECLEKRVYYKVISGWHLSLVFCRVVIIMFTVAGMHASISTHVCGEYLDQSTGQWVKYSQEISVHTISCRPAGSKFGMLRHPGGFTP